MSTLRELQTFKKQSGFLAHPVYLSATKLIQQKEAMCGLVFLLVLAMAMATFKQENGEFCSPCDQDCWYTELVA